MLDSIVAETIDLLPHLILGVILFFAFFITGKILAKILHRVTTKTHPESELIFSLFSRLIVIIFIVLGVIAGLTNIGINVSALIAGIGIIGLGLGYALKDVLLSIISGILVIVYRPVKINDQIIVGDFQGRVAKIDLRYTTLDSNNNKILIPNTTLLTTAITIVNN
jgi:small conductance mechanosensitive channel